jgi:hypothetical protein
METQKIDEGCIKRLANAVETLLLDRSDKGFESALISIGPLLEDEFPNEKLRKLRREINRKYDAAREKAHDRIQSRNPPPPSLYCSFIKGPSRKWLKKTLWQLFTESLRHNNHGV